MPFKPYSDNVLIRRKAETAAEVNGLRIPDSAKEKPDQGEVVEVGPGYLTESGVRLPMPCRKGDIVLFRKFAGGKEINIDGEDLLLMRENEILGQLLPELPSGILTTFNETPLPPDFQEQSIG